MYIHTHIFPIFKRQVGVTIILDTLLECIYIFYGPTLQTFSIQDNECKCYEPDLKSVAIDFRGFGIGPNNKCLQDQALVRSRIILVLLCRNVLLQMNNYIYL